MDIMLVIRGLVTVLLVILFIGLCIWVYHPKRAKHFEESGKLPFMDEKEQVNE